MTEAPPPASGRQTWVVGDVHGCYATLTRLLERAGVDPARDRLLLLGDLVNRGPRSLEVLRWARSTSAERGSRFECVLGNHDLHLIARARGLRRGRPADTLDAILAAPDRDDLIAWLSRRPFALDVEGALIVHAGVQPAWTVAETLSRAAALSTALLRPDSDGLLTPPSRDEDDGDRAELRADLETLTRLRMLDAEGNPSPYSGPPGDAPEGLRPWFEIPGRRTAYDLVVFGHWAALGLYVGPRLFGLDSGCAWGRRLTALRLSDRTLVQEEVADDERRG